MSDDRDGLVRLSNDCLVLMVGRTGLRLGATFLNGIDAEYGHQAKGLWEEGERRLGDQLELRKSTFYAPKSRDQGEDELPPFRGVAIDLDSKSVDEAGLSGRLVAKLNYTGGGAEMLWPEGYTEAEKLKDQLTAVLDQAGAGSVRNFILFHGTSHGTGSGVASWVVDHLRAEYGQRREQARNLLTFTVTPSGNTDEAIPYKDVEAVSGPSYYNTVLTLNTLLGTRPGQPEVRPGAFRTIVNVMDNPAAARVWRERTGSYPDSSTYEEINHLMARAALGITSPLRFGPTDLGNVFVYFSRDHDATLTVPAVGPVGPTEDRAPFQLAYDGLLHQRLAQSDGEGLDQCYFLFRGRVNRAGLRHVHDLLRDRYGFSTELYSCVPEPCPGEPVSFTAMVRPDDPPPSLQHVLENARANLEAGAHLRDYEGWGYTPDMLAENVEALQARLVDGRDPNRVDPDADAADTPWTRETPSPQDADAPRQEA